MHDLKCILLVWYTFGQRKQKLPRPNKNNSWFQVSQPCFIWVGRSEKHSILKNILF